MSLYHPAMRGRMIGERRRVDLVNGLPGLSLEICRNEDWYRFSPLLCLASFPMLLILVNETNP